ncbi:hypothetical protein CLOLEP_02331 [[Clostridium] leptum DSM 753]|uniref:Uncharacterized protein n=1 Tax=[Clostridium] leptum DSM 753 TaxID=428125 RepID=A7VUT4_9FIRM|nr:hypothetical protein CLOLEP_02331 [[Clostridium] leptum DSM 753]
MLIRQFQISFSHLCSVIANCAGYAADRKRLRSGMSSNSKSHAFSDSFKIQFSSLASKDVLLRPAAAG